MPVHDVGPSLRPPRSTCKICWNSIFVYQDTDWMVRPCPGLAHQECVEKLRRARLSPSYRRF